MEKAPPAGRWRGLAGTREGPASRAAPSPGSPLKPGPLLGRWGAEGPVALLGSHSVRERSGPPILCRRAPRLPTPPFRALPGVFSQRGCVGAGAGGGTRQRVAAQQGARGPICCSVHNGIQVLLVTPAHCCLPPKDGPTPPAHEVPSGNCARLSHWPSFPWRGQAARATAHSSAAEGSWALAVTGIGTPE